MVPWKCCLRYFLAVHLNSSQDYSTVGLSQGILKFLQHLREFGLVYQRKVSRFAPNVVSFQNHLVMMILDIMSICVIQRTAGRFYPTRLVMNIASGEKKGMMERHKDGFLVVETNYRVYAYTGSDLQVALIGLFAEVLYRYDFPTSFYLTHALVEVQVVS